MKQQQGLDAFADVLRITLNGALEEKDERANVLDSLHEVQAQMRDLEMNINHYKIQAQKSVQLSAFSSDLAVRLRSAGAAAALQTVISDIERRLEGLKEAHKNLVLRLDL